ncbi:MAG: MFS transporter [Pedobacter sp.]|uniref:MFS transporter n=1 Tax=Pedobacter sp. TaxID=1411316 RepID=UPI00356B09A6
MNIIQKRTIKPQLSLYQIFNMSFGFLGIQFGFALQTGNASRILQTFGADIEHLSLFWLAAPISGMLIQPIIGHYSDHTWTRLGRRRPYFLVGAIIAAISLALMPNAVWFTAMLPPLMIGAGMLMLMDASFNVAMEPFRALVADNLPSNQRSIGFSVQTFLIGTGAIIGSFLPYLLAEYGGISKTAAPGEVPDNVIYSFYAGALVLLGTLLWTVFTTKEYSPEEHQSFDPDHHTEASKKGLIHILKDFSTMPQVMVRLGIVQFFSWFALFSMWVFTTPAIAQHIYHLAPTDTSSTHYADAGNWTGILFGIYNVVSAIYAALLPSLFKIMGKRNTHIFSLAAAGIGLLSIYFIHDVHLLIFPMIAVGLAWGSILTTPYAILSNSIPSHKMGIYMGLFNFFITLPQLVNGFIGGYMIKYLFDGYAIYALITAGAFMILAALSTLLVKPQNKEAI